MTLKHTQQKIEEAFDKKFPGILVSETFDAINKLPIKTYQNIPHKEEIKDFLLSSISTALQDFIRETRIEERDEQPEKIDDTTIRINWATPAFNEAVRLQKEKQDNYMQGI